MDFLSILHFFFKLIAEGTLLILFAYIIRNFKENFELKV